MSKKWNPKVIENVVSDKSEADIYQQILVEVAGIIYSDFCQLPKIQSSDSLLDENNFLQRTGTDA